MNPITITVTDGPNDGRFLTSKTGEKPVVGRGQASTFSVMDPRLSREHFELQDDGETWTIRDLGSSNGTAINGVLIDETQVLNDDDVIIAGDTRFRVSFSEPSVQDEADSGKASGAGFILKLFSFARGQKPSSDSGVHV